MKLEDQVVSLEQAKRLKELGVLQESCFYYNQYDNTVHLDIAKDHCGGDERCWSAFTVAELGKMLPAGYKTTKGHSVFIVEGMPDEPFSIQRESTEADARAKMVIYLLEEGLLKA